MTTVLECAIAGETDYIVSGDRHLLKLGSCQGISIVFFIPALPLRLREASSSNWQSFPG